MKTHDLSYPKAVIELAIKDLTPSDLEHKAACEFALALLTMHQQFNSVPLDA